MVRQEQGFIHLSALLVKTVLGNLNSFSFIGVIVYYPTVRN